MWPDLAGRGWVTMGVGSHLGSQLGYFGQLARQYGSSGGGFRGWLQEAQVAESAWR